jgi:predicted nucleotidyltransferase
MKERDRKIAMELKRRLSASAPLLDLRVFGSRARGDSDQYSDMDVFVLVETVNKDLKQKIRDIVWEVGFENFLVISPLIFTKDEVENTPLRSSQIVRNITEEGVSI